MLVVARSLVIIADLRAVGSVERDGEGRMRESGGQSKVA